MKKFTLFLSLMILSACGSSSQTLEGVPKWVVSQPDLCGVGIHKSRNNLGSDRTFANAKARTDLSKKLETKVKAMVKTYEGSGEADSEDFTEELSTAVSISLSKTVINGSNTKSLEKHKDYVYSLVCLNPSVLTDAINEMNTLSHAQRKALARRSDILHQELEEQMKDYR